MKKPPLEPIGIWATVFWSMERGSFHIISHAKGDSFSGSTNGTGISLTAETKSPGHDAGLGIPPCKQRI